MNFRHLLWQFDFQTGFSLSLLFEITPKIVGLQHICYKNAQNLEDMSHKVDG